MAIKPAEANSGPPAGCRQGWLAGCVVVVVLLAVAIAGVIIVVRDRLQSPAAPDLAAVMSSPAVLDRHEAAAAWLTRLSGQAQQADPWLVLQGQDLADDCGVTSAGEAGFMGPAQLGVLCERRVTRYYAFGGPLHARLAQLKAEFARSGAFVSACAGPGETRQEPVLQRAVCGTFPVPAALVVPSAFPGRSLTGGYTWLGRTDQPDAQALNPGILPPSPTTFGGGRDYIRQEVPAKATILRGLRAHDYVLIVCYYIGYYYNLGT